jgi:hypothetical protein
MGRHRADIIRFITECPSTGLRAKCLEGLKIPQEVRASQISYSRLRLRAVWKTVVWIPGIEGAFKQPQELGVQTGVQLARFRR